MQNNYRDELFLGGSSTINKEFPNSTSVKSIDYNRVTKTLMVVYRKPEVVYSYHGVPEETVYELIAAPSAGKYLADHIKKGGYPYHYVGATVANQVSVPTSY